LGQRHRLLDVALIAAPRSSLVRQTLRQVQTHRALVLDELGGVLHIAAQVPKSFGQLVHRTRGAAEQLVQTLDANGDYWHSGTSLSQSKSVQYRVRMSSTP